VIYVDAIEVGIGVIAILSGAAAINSYRAMSTTSRLAERVSALEAQMEILLNYFKNKK
jgi:Tfp pilus assembly protein PilE